jgi:allantoinase
MAIQIIILHEWESMPWHRSRPMPANSHYSLDFMSLGGHEYGVRHGIWRLLDIVEKHGCGATIMTNGLTAVLFPESVRACTVRGHEVVAHQWDQAVFPPTFRSRDEERDALLKTKQKLEEVTQHKVRGYMSPGPRPTPHTVELLAELGYDWTADYVDSDFPYFIPVRGQQLVAIPYATPGCIDFDLLPYSLPERLKHMKFIFDATHEESGRQPMMFSYAVHTHWGGTTGMAHLLDKFLAHALASDSLWRPLGSEIADFWRHSERATAIPQNLG